MVPGEQLVQSAPYIKYLGPDATERKLFTTHNMSTFLRTQVSVKLLNGHLHDKLILNEPIYFFSFDKKYKSKSMLYLEISIE